MGCRQVGRLPDPDDSALTPTPATATVEQLWSDDLRLEVRNAVAATPAGVLPVAGLGLDGMRRRLESVGGHLQAAPTTRSDGFIIWTPPPDYLRVRPRWS